MVILVSHLIYIEHVYGWPWNIMDNTYFEYIMQLNYLLLVWKRNHGYPTSHWQFYMMASSNGNIFRVILALCAGNSPVTGILICAWINGWVNNLEAGDLIRHRAHYDMIYFFLDMYHCKFLLLLKICWIRVTQNYSFGEIGSQIEKSGAYYHMISPANNQGPGSI